MRSAAEANAINRVLKARGLGSLEEPGTAQKLATLVKDHRHFGSLLKACEPVLRQQMYDAMSPYLKFPAKPLYDYIVDAKEYAAAAELPTIDEQGNLHQYYPPEVRSNQDVIDTAVNAIEALTAHGYLDVICCRCTKAARFYGLNKAESIWKARNASWAYNELDGAEICPDCLERRK